LGHPATSSGRLPEERTGPAQERQSTARRSKVVGGVGVVCLTRGKGGRASDNLRTLPQHPMSAPDGLQASQPCQDRLDHNLGHYTGAHANTGPPAATPSAGSGQELGSSLPYHRPNDWGPNEHDSAFRQACHRWPVQVLPRGPRESPRRPLRCNVRHSEATSSLPTRLSPTTYARGP